MIPIYLSIQWSWVDTKYSILLVQRWPTTAHTESNMDWVVYKRTTAYTKYWFHRELHTRSTAYTEHCIQRVHCTPNTVYTEYCMHPILYLHMINCLPLPASPSSPISYLSAEIVVLNSLHSPNYEHTTEQICSGHCVSLPIYHLLIHHLQVLL